MRQFTPTNKIPDLWHYLKAASDAGRPVLLYGMGNGADKVWEACDTFCIPVADTFASDGFVRGHCFHGRRVLSFSEACDRYGADNMLVLLSFGSSRPDVLDTIRAAAAKVETYVPDLPVSGHDLFTADFVSADRDSISAARSLFADDESRRVFDLLIQAKLTGRFDLLEATASPRSETWRILRPARFASVMDLGAYTGDSLRELMTVSPALRAALCMEPDARTYRKLNAFCGELTEAGALCAQAVNKGAWSETTTLTFHGSGNRNASLVNGIQSKEKVTAVPVTTPDEAWAETYGDKRVDFIKYDVEGAEREALLGSRSLITRDAPALLVSAYHAADDLWSLPLLLHDLRPDYRLYLRRMTGVPAWDIEVYAGADL